MLLAFASRPQARLESEVEPSYWHPKLERTKTRDLENAAMLKELGYRVLIIWECVSRKPEQAAEQIANFFESLR
jgi:DNA mismatch endonuclease (patch repair protein)